MDEERHTVKVPLGLVDGQASCQALGIGKAGLFLDQSALFGGSDSQDGGGRDGEKERKGHYEEQGKAEVGSEHGDDEWVCVGRWGG